MFQVGEHRQKKMLGQFFVSPIGGCSVIHKHSQLLQDQGFVCTDQVGPLTYFQLVTPVDPADRGELPVVAIEEAFVAPSLRTLHCYRVVCFVFSYFFLKNDAGNKIIRIMIHHI